MTTNTTDTITTAEQWADAIDRETLHAESVGTMLSEAYASGSLAGVALSTDDPRISDRDSAVVVSADGRWAVRYDVASGSWFAAAPDALATGTVVALVGECTPESYEYGDYRGWVELDREDGTWLRDLTDAQVRAARVTWTEWPADYERLGTVR